MEQPGHGVEPEVRQDDWLSSVPAVGSLFPPGKASARLGRLDGVLHCWLMDCPSSNAAIAKPAGVLIMDAIRMLPNALGTNGDRNDA